MHCKVIESDTSDTALALLLFNQGLVCIMQYILYGYLNIAVYFIYTSVKIIE